MRDSPRQYQRGDAGQPWQRPRPDDRPQVVRLRQQIEERATEQQQAEGDRYVGVRVSDDQLVPHRQRDQPCHHDQEDVHRHTGGEDRIGRGLDMTVDEVIRSAEIQRPQGDDRDQGTRYQGPGSVGDGESGGQDRFTQRDEQEQPTAFDHVVGVELDVLGVEHSSG
jgi:hypothetical protein